MGDKSKTTAACVTHDYSRKIDVTGGGALEPSASVGETNRTSSLHYISQLSESANQQRFRAEMNSQETGVGRGGYKSALKQITKRYIENLLPEEVRRFKADL